MTDPAHDFAVDVAYAREEQWQRHAETISLKTAVETRQHLLDSGAYVARLLVWENGGWVPVRHTGL